MLVLAVAVCHGRDDVAVEPDSAAQGGQDEGQAQPGVAVQGEDRRGQNGRVAGGKGKLGPYLYKYLQQSITIAIVYNFKAISLPKGLFGLKIPSEIL